MTEDRAADALREWNDRNPIGTPVAYWPGLQSEPPVLGETRSAAWRLPSGADVVMVTGRAGGIALSHVLPLAALLAAERERAWNEGWGAAYTMARNWGHVDGWEDEWPNNPYRTEPAPGEEESRG